MNADQQSPSPPVDPALRRSGLMLNPEERVARALADAADGVPFDRSYEKSFWFGIARHALAALTTEDLLALLQARSDEVVVTLTRAQVSKLADDRNSNEWVGNWFRSKLSTALESE